MDGIEIVRGLDLDLHRGRTLAVVGPSGCGKTTLARGLLGLIPLQSGNIALNGKSWLKLLAREPKTARHRVQIVFQDPNTALNPRQTVGAVIRESIRHRGDPCDLNLITERLAQVELSPDLIPRYPHELSGGQRQRVALARVLAQRPDVLICDEPVSSLDAQLQWKLLELLQRLCRDEDLALLLISHDPEQVRHFADAVLSMADGKAIEANLDAGAASASIAPKG